MIFSSQERPGRWDLKACEAKAKLESEGHGGIETKCVIEYCHRTMPVDSDK
jgi:hypothetical protein